MINKHVWWGHVEEISLSSNNLSWFRYASRFETYLGCREQGLGIPIKQPSFFRFDFTLG